MGQASFSEFVAKTDGRVEPLSEGALTPDASAILPELLGARPSARKMGEGLLCAAPSGADWYVRSYPDKPSQGSVADLLHEIQSVASARAVKPTSPASAGLMDIVSNASTVLRKNRIRFVLNALVDGGFVRSAIIAPLVNERVKVMVFSNFRHKNACDEARVVLNGCLQNEDTARFDFLANDYNEDCVDGALLCDRLQGQKLTIHLPADRKSGFALIAVDPEASNAQALQDVPTALRVLLPKRKFSGLKIPSFWRIAALTGILLAGLFLVSPADIRVSNQARAIPTQSVVVSVPFGAYVDSTFVEPGERVGAGQSVAHLSSPELESRKAEEKLTQRLEEISAAEALDQGDYGAFQLAEKRGEIANLRETYLDKSIAQLNVKAPVAGTVVETISGADKGAFLQPGTTIITVQPKAEFDVLIDVEPADAPLVKTGQTGFVFFRGLGDHAYALEIIDSPQRTTDAATGNARLMTRARIKDVEQNQLLVGLTGFAKINVDRGPRVQGMTRPVVEYIRLKTWTFLGWQI